MYLPISPHIRKFNTSTHLPIFFKKIISIYEHQATGKITQLSVGPLLAQAIYNIHNKKSISALFK